MAKKTFIKDFILYFTILAFGGILYNVGSIYAPLEVISVKSRNLVGILCLISYFLGNAIMFAFHKLRVQR